MGSWRESFMRSDFSGVPRTFEIAERSSKVQVDIWNGKYLRKMLKMDLECLPVSSDKQVFAVEKTKEICGFVKSPQFSCNFVLPTLAIASLISTSRKDWSLQNVLTASLKEAKFAVAIFVRKCFLGRITELRGNQTNKTFNWYLGTGLQNYVVITPTKHLTDIWEQNYRITL